MTTPATLAPRLAELAEEFEAVGPLTGCSCWSSWLPSCLGCRRI